MANITVTNVTNGRIFLDNYGLVPPLGEATVADNDSQVVELLAGGALSTDPPPESDPDPSKLVGVKAKVDFADASPFVIDVNGATGPADYIGADGVARPLSDLASDSELTAAIAGIGGRYRGDYASGTAYKAGDVVLNSGGLYSRKNDGTPSGAFIANQWNALIAKDVVGGFASIGVDGKLDPVVLPAGSGSGDLSVLSGSVDVDGNVLVEFTSNWGITIPGGEPYYDDAGATPGEDAIPVAQLDGTVALIQLDGQEA